MIGPSLALVVWHLRLLAFGVGDWVLLVGSGGVAALVGQLTIGYKAIRANRAEKQEQPLKERVVMWDEAEAIFRMQGATIDNQRHDNDELRARLKTCEDWQRAHLLICPLRFERRHGRGE